MMSGERVIATGNGWLRVITPAVYRRLRAHRTPRQPSTADRRSIRPVTLGSAPDAALIARSWTASIDAEDPYFFDHAVDHLPGMAIYEAACAVATSSSRLQHPRVTSFDGRFHRFVELDRPLELTIESLQSLPSSDGRFVIAASSEGLLAMDATIGVSSYAGEELPAS